MSDPFLGNLPPKNPPVPAAHPRQLGKDEKDLNLMDTADHYIINKIFLKQAFLVSKNFYLQRSKIENFKKKMFSICS